MALKIVSLMLIFTRVWYKINACKILTKKATTIGSVRGNVGMVTPTKMINGAQKIFKNLIYAIISPNKYRKSITFVNLK